MIKYQMGKRAFSSLEANSVVEIEQHLAEFLSAHNYGVVVIEQPQVKAKAKVQDETKK